jgi:OOP family OmpA-OmpF porin
MHAVFSGSSVNLGGNMSDAEREKALNTLRTVFSASGLAVSEMDNIAKMVSESTNKAIAQLTSLGPNFKANELLDVLNKSIINFPTGSSEVPAMSRELLQQAAGKFKQLPVNTVVQIGGYTDNTGDPNANVQLSQHRADAVKNALVQAGVNSNMLQAKGFGSANPVASNDTPEGRFQNRRIEYSLKQ